MSYRCRTHSLWRKENSNYLIISAFRLYFSLFEAKYWEPHDSRPVIRLGSCYYM